MLSSKPRPGSSSSYQGVSNNRDQTSSARPTNSKVDITPIPEPRTNNLSTGPNTNMNISDTPVPISEGMPQDPQFPITLIPTAG